MMRSAKTIKHLFLAAFVLFLAYYSMHSRSTTSAAHVSVAMLDVGQGDSILIASPGGRQLLIDGGKDDRVLAELSRVMPRGDRSIDVVIATHPDADHIGGLPLVLDRYQVGLLLAPNVVTESEVADELYRVIAAKGIPAYYARRGMNLTLDPSLSATLRILFPDRETVGWETNAASVVARLSVGERSALFTGDAPQSIETHLASIGSKEIDVDVLKVGHHGSKTSSSEAFLRAASPAIALISAGAGNRYGHPAPEVVARLRALHIPFIATIDAGTSTLATDGVKWYRNN